MIFNKSEVKCFLIFFCSLILYFFYALLNAYFVNLSSYTVPLSNTLKLYSDFKGSALYYVILYDGILDIFIQNYVNPSCFFVIFCLINLISGIDRIAFFFVVRL